MGFNGIAFGYKYIDDHAKSWLATCALAHSKFLDAGSTSDPPFPRRWKTRKAHYEGTRDGATVRKSIPFNMANIPTLGSSDSFDGVTMVCTGFSGEKSSIIHVAP